MCWAKVLKTVVSTLLLLWFISWAARRRWGLAQVRPPFSLRPLLLPDTGVALSIGAGFGSESGSYSRCCRASQFCTPCALSTSTSQATGHLLPQSESQFRVAHAERTDKNVHITRNRTYFEGKRSPASIMK
jgi:hypothetical protein